MTTWADFLGDLRLALDDDDDDPRWTDKDLLIYTKDAVRDYSQWFPKRMDQVQLSLTSGSTAFLLPSDYVYSIYVECPVGTFLEERQTRPGLKYQTQSTPSRFYTEGGNLYINSSPTSDTELYLTYFSIHDIPDDENDSAFEFSVSERDLELLRLYVKAKVLGQMRTKQSQLDRFKPGSGKRDDNPLMPETGSLMDEYYMKIAERTPGGVVTLYRPGRTR